MISITDPDITHLQNDVESEHSMSKRFSQHSFFDLAFRSFFVSAAAVSIVSLTLWLGYLNGFSIIFSNGLTPTVWHIHEMLFGFAATVAAGFLLTAVQTWTGRESIKGGAVILLLCLWLLVRVSLFIDESFYIYSAVILQTLWWLVVIATFSSLVLKAKNRRNYLFIALLSVLMCLNIGVLVLDLQGRTDLALHFSRTAVLMFGLLMGVLGGRVIPFFTNSATQIGKINSPEFLTPLLFTTSILGILVFFTGQFIALPFTPAALMISAGLLHMFRLSYWHSAATIKVSLLWSLHLSYLSLAIGLLLLGASYLTSVILFSDALHMITIGAMGLMILAMMSRVSLGHTGRKLQPHKLVSVSFVFMFCAAVARVLLPMFEQIQLAWNLSAILWIAAGFIFLSIYIPILSSAKLSK
ncbi:NnrS family protein [Thalassotalea fonticola]|uniref:NnrS family protein n=1 Tax=Thalassotalea fonticola TaxID=3065649 RepID=A0ABZ0GT88_9GAMM|nr:NnrS family protein [Colwelliaceae bacterium S1-1]